MSKSQLLSDQLSPNIYKNIYKDIYKKYQIEEIQCYQVLTDTGSTSIQFIIVSEPESLFPEWDIQYILFEIFSKTDICKRLTVLEKI